MLWIKRNLFLAISGLVALALLAGGGFYVYSGLGRDAQLNEEVQATRTKLTDLYKPDTYFPSATNIAAAKAETARLHAEVSKAHKLFTPIPTEKVDARAFRTLRDNTLDELRKLAGQAGTRLPTSEGYSFSFQTQKARTEFAVDTFPLVPEQMMEIRALCVVLFEARVNQIGNIRRARVSMDDRRSSNAGDYVDGRVLNNDIIAVAQTASHPYEFTFFCFTSELAAVLNSLERSPHGFVVKAMMVEPDTSAPGAVGGFPAPGPDPFPPRPNMPRPPGRFNQPPPAPGRPAAPGAAAAVRPPAGDKLVYVLKEKRLKVTMLVYTLKPAR